MAGIFLKLLLSLDFLAPTMHLNVNGSWAVKTYTGVLISLLCVTMAIYASTLQVIDYFDTTNPFIAAELKLNTVYPEIDLVKNRHLPMMFAFAGGTAFINTTEAKKYFTVQYTMWTYIIGEDASTDFQFIINDLPVVPCRELIEKGTLNPKEFTTLGGFQKYFPDFGICIDASGVNLTVIGSNADAYQKTVLLRVLPCSLPDHTQCKSKEEVNAVTIQLLKPAIGLNLGNIDSPINYEINADDYISLNTDIDQVTAQQLIKNTIYDAKGFLFPVQEKVTYTTYDPPFLTTQWRDTTQIKVTTDDITNFVAKPYFEFQWKSGQKFNLIKRNYNSFLDYLGNIGGINSLIMACCFTVYFIWHGYQEKLAMVHAIYGLKQEKGKCCRKKRVHPRKSGTFDVNSNVTAKTELPHPDIEEKMEKGTIYVSDKIIDEAWDNIKASLDLVTVCREVNVIKYLSSVLIKEYQKALIPLAILSKQMQEKRKSESDKAIKKNPLFGIIAKFASDFPMKEEKEEDKVQEGVSALLRSVKDGEMRKERSKTVVFNNSPEVSVDPAMFAESGPVLDRLELEMNDHLLVAIKESAKFLDVPFLVSPPQNLDPQSEIAFSNGDFAPSPLASSKPAPRLKKIEMTSVKSKFSKAPNNPNPETFS